jgi:pyruvate,orthophosphate dikinase
LLEKNNRRFRRMEKKFVYFFGDGKADGDAAMRDLLGGKGANLAEMTRLGIPVPPGFTITSEACRYYFSHGGKMPEELEKQVEEALMRLEELMGARFGDPSNPLLISIRSGSKFSMPGMMDTVLNLGLNNQTIQGLIKQTKNKRFSYDSYRRFISMYGDVVLGIEKKLFSDILEGKKKSKAVTYDIELNEEDLREITDFFLRETEKEKKIPEDPKGQLWEAIKAVFASWNIPRAKFYRKVHGISDHWGTAANVQTMVYGNRGDDCATGVVFTRNPANGEKLFYGEYLKNAQGEDVVAGIRTPLPICKSEKEAETSLEEEMPELYDQLYQFCKKLEDHYKEMQDIEFTIQNGKLFILQTRNGKRTGIAALKIAIDMVEEGMISKEEAVQRVEAGQLLQLLAPVFETKLREKTLKEGNLLGRGLNAGPGAASGKITLTAEKAVEFSKTGSAVILVREETSPEDIAGMKAASGILTSRGGMTSHAAVVARGMGKSCIVGCTGMQVNYDKGTILFGDVSLKEGDGISIDGTTGEVMLGLLPTISSDVIRVLIEESLKPEDSEMYQYFEKFMTWVDQYRKLGVRTNADTPEDARIARGFGAEGIGLARTEHMFFGKDRITAMREMILSSNQEERERALMKLLPIQRGDFSGIFQAMEELPVTIRLLDPPLHEFLPKEKDQINEVAREMGVPASRIRAKIKELHEFNPMLGHRGCRLGITYPEVYRMQAKGIFEAASSLLAQGIKVVPEVMIPLVGTLGEFQKSKSYIDDVAEEVQKATGIKIEYKVGTMMEIPRACLIATEIGREADFFSFGTNDLTQMTFGFSRDDAGVFLAEFIEKGILKRDPFQTLDDTGVGRLVRMGVNEGRKDKPELKIGICGEHGGDPDSIRFFHFAGLDYVSCSPYRVPIARLAAAHAALGTETPEEKD